MPAFIVCSCVDIPNKILCNPLLFHFINAYWATWAFAVKLTGDIAISKNFSLH